MKEWNLLIAPSDVRALEIMKIMELPEADWKAVGFYSALTGLRVKKIIVCGFNPTYLDMDRADKWLDDVARMRLAVGCQDNVWTI